HVVTGAVMLGMIGFAWWSYRHTDSVDRMLVDERARADALLRNVLPAPIADRLKVAPGTIAESFPEATVMFADIVGFTPLTQQLSAPRVVDVLDRLFSAFDDIAEA